MKSVTVGPAHHKLRDQLHLEADADWQALKSATPEVIEAWLTANVASMEDIRRVLKMLILLAQHTRAPR